MSLDFKIVVLLSGRGSNFLNLCQKLTVAKIACVISNLPEAPGLAHADAFNIPKIALSRSSYPNLKDFKIGILEAVKDQNPNLVVLAGFMQVLSPEFISSFPGRIVNIHPSLLPQFPGLHTHERALSEGVKRHGCTVHYVDEGVDTGPIIAQADCPVMPRDTEDTLAARVLEREHALYPWVIDGIALGEVGLLNGRVYHSTEYQKRANELGFII